MTISYLPTPAEHAWIERASAHAAPADKLNPEARWAQYEVTDESVARVLMALERGTALRQSPNGRWYGPDGSALNGLSLSKTIGECIRTGLLIHHVSGALIPAKVHLSVWGGEWDGAWDRGRWASACGEPGENMGPKRTRLHRDPLLVDCLKCLDPL